MKHHLLLSFLVLCISPLFSQIQSFELEKYDSNYEREILQNKDATHLELLMAMGSEASSERTLAVKKELDEFIGEVKSSGMTRFPEVKLMKELHRKVRDRFLTHYKYVSPFDQIFVSGQYNCVSATALFALILDELEIPYAIQEQPTHVYIMAYPDTKAISVEMTASKDAYYLPGRKDVSKAINTLIDLGMTTPLQVRQQGELQIYNMFYNTNSVVDLKQLAGIQYFNEAITAVNKEDFIEAFDIICKTVKLYDVEKTRLFKREVLTTLLGEAKFDSMKDMRYLVEYANLKNADQSKAYYQYAKFLSEQLISKGNRVLADSSNVYLVKELADTIVAAKLSGLYYMGLSEYFSNAYNLTKQVEYAEKAYKISPDLPAIQLWLTRSILQSLDKYEDEELLTKMDNYAKQYPFLQRHNLYLTGYFYAYADFSVEFYQDDDGVKGKKYLDLALKTRDSMEDKEVLDQDQIGWMFAEAGAHLYREEDYKSALKILEEGLKLAPNHERILARLEYVKLKVK